MGIKDANTDLQERTTTNGVATLAPEGSLASFQPLYAGPKDNENKFTWLDKEPEDVADAAENDKTAQHAIITRLEKSQDSRKKFDLHSIIIQSPWLKKALKEILLGYPGVHCGLKRLVFEAPFEPFVHRWSNIEAFRKRTDLDDTTVDHISLLYNILKDELRDVIKTFEDSVQHGVVTFEHLWTIFQPGAIVYANSHHGAPAALKFKSGKYGKTQCGPAYQLTMETVSWNGSHFGREVEGINLLEFSGTRSILGLNAFPITFHPHQSKAEEHFIARGQKFEQLAGCHYRQYDGFAITWDRNGKEIPISCSGRIIVDADTFSRFSNRYVPHIEQIHPEEGAPEAEPADKLLDPTNSGTDKYIFGRQAETKRVHLTKDQQLISSPVVRGYSLKKKKWLLFYLDLIQTIKFDTNSFSSLVLPSDQKELILSFAESQALNRDTFDDIITGKGRGHITLLSGPPGVGKTLTAESVAEYMQSPLYMMSAGDLGVNPDQVEFKLTNILEMIAKWNAVLLLDECDVFLEKRSTHDLERNKLVSIFLRVLEYYEGILFLTTNRIADIDAAFQSRIHVSMTYPDLDDAARLRIWKGFVGQMEGEIKLVERDLVELSKVELNGRQIKNVLKSAILLARRKGTPVAREHVDLVLGIEKRRPGVARGFE